LECTFGGEIVADGVQTIEGDPRGSRIAAPVFVIWRKVQSSMSHRNAMTYSRRKSHTDAWIRWVTDEYHLARQAVGTPPSILAVHVTFNWAGRTNLCPDTSLTTSRDLTPETIFRELDRIYRHMLPRLIGSHYEKPAKRHLQPRTLAFVDLPNSRSQPPEGRYKIRTRYNPHVHAVMILRADLAAKIPDGTLNIFFCDIAKKALGERLDTIQVDQIPLSDIGAVTGYSSKLSFRRLTGIDPTDLYHVWPSALSERSKNNRSWEPAPTPTMPQPRTRRRDGLFKNSHDQRRQEIYADPGNRPPQKLDGILTLVDHAPQLKSLYSTIPRWCRAKVEEAFRIMLHGQEEEMWRFVRSCRAEWDTLDLHDIAAPATCSDLARYATGEPAAPCRPRTPVHLQGALVHNAQLDQTGLAVRKIADGDMFEYVLLVEPNPLRATAIGFRRVLPPEFGVSRYVDRDGQFDLCFRRPLIRALALLGWRDKKKRTLGVLADCS
jgi:hypothetical protein